MWGGKDKSDEPKSPLETFLSTVTQQSMEMNAALGFPGVLLLFAIVFAALPVVPGLTASGSFIALSAVSMGGAIATYIAERYYLLRRADAQAELFSDYVRLLLEKYFASKTDISAEHISFAWNNILMPMLQKRSELAPGTVPNKPLIDA